MALPTVRQLEYFISAANIGTLSGAAAANHIAQPSLTEQINSLEQNLGVSLFTRSPRGLQLTDAGKQLLPLASSALGSMRDFSEWSRRLRSLEVGMVSFGTFNTAHLYLLTELISTFRKLHPSVTVHTSGLNSSDVADNVRKGKLEAGLVQLPVNDTDLDVSPAIFSDQVVYISKDPLPTEGAITVADMQGRPLIFSESSWAYTDPLRISLLDRAQQLGIKLKPVIEVEYTTHATELALRGLGDSLASYHVVRHLLSDEKLYWAPLDPPYYERYAFVTKKGGAVSPATAEFMQIAHRLMQQLSVLSPFEDPLVPTNRSRSR